MQTSQSHGGVETHHYAVVQRPTVVATRLRNRELGGHHDTTPPGTVDEKRLASCRFRLVKGRKDGLGARGSGERVELVNECGGL